MISCMITHFTIENKCLFIVGPKNKYFLEHGFKMTCLILIKSPLLYLIKIWGTLI